MFLSKKLHAFIVALPVAFICCLIMPYVSSGTVKEVTLFPDSAKLEETVKIPSQLSDTNNHKVIILLPSQADPESLIVYPACGRGNNQGFRIGLRW